MSALAWRAVQRTLYVARVLMILAAAAGLSCADSNGEQLLVSGFGVTALVTIETVERWPTRPRPIGLDPLLFSAWGIGLAVINQFFSHVLGNCDESVAGLLLVRTVVFALGMQAVWRLFRLPDPFPAPNDPAPSP